MTLSAIAKTSIAMTEVLPFIEHPIRMPFQPFDDLNDHSWVAIELNREDLLFSSAHFAQRTDGSSEPLHGHNYSVELRVQGRSDALGYVLDFIPLKHALRSLIGTLNHRVLLPGLSLRMKIIISNGEAAVSVDGSRYVFPESDVVVLPLVNITCELLADYIGKTLLSYIPDLDLLVRVEECPGQGASWCSSTCRARSSKTLDTNDKYWLSKAIEISRIAAADYGSPFGAVVAINDELLGKGQNETNSSNVLIRHAEVVALESASRSDNNSRLRAATLYSSCAPCFMCLGAAFYSNIARVVYALDIADVVNLGSGDPPFEPTFLNLRLGLGIELIGGEFREEALEVVKDAYSKRSKI